MATVFSDLVRAESTARAVAEMTTLTPAQRDKAKALVAVLKNARGAAFELREIEVTEPTPAPTN